MRFFESQRSVRISAYTNQSRVSHSVRMRENSAEEYPKPVSYTHLTLPTILRV